ARHRVVVLRRRDEEAVGGADGGLERAHALGAAIDIEVGVVVREIADLERLDRHAVRGLLDRGAQQPAVERGAAQAAGDAGDDEWALRWHSRSLLVPTRRPAR